MKDKFKETLSSILSYLLKVDRRTLLWTNANPTATFAPQTVAVDLSDYDEVEVVFRHNWQEFIQLNARAAIGRSGNAYVSRSDTFLTQERKFTVSTTGITFDACKLGSNAQVFNDHSIPFRIYGIKIGGVLRSPVISRLCAILKIGGGVDEGRCEGTAEQDDRCAPDIEIVYGATKCGCKQHCGFRAPGKSVANRIFAHNDDACSATRGEHKHLREHSRLVDIRWSFIRQNVFNSAERTTGILLPLSNGITPERGWAV